MAQVILTFKIMPESPDVNLDDVESKAKEKITAFGGDWNTCERVPVAFGLVAVQPTFRMDEDAGDTEVLENDICTLDEVASCEVIGCSRAL